MASIQERAIVAGVRYLDWTKKIKKKCIKCPISETGQFSFGWPKKNEKLTGQSVSQEIEQNHKDVPRPRVKTKVITNSNKFAVTVLLETNCSSMMVDLLILQEYA